MPTLSPQFRLFSANLQLPVDPSTKKPVDIKNFLLEYEKSVIKDSDKEDPKSPGWGTTPVGLRWSMLPEFGFPREAFKVFRRKQKYDFRNWLETPQTIAGSMQFNFDSEDQYVVVVVGAPLTNGALKFEAIAHNGKVIPELTQKITTRQNVILKSPFIRALRVTGNGTLSGIAAVKTTTVVNQNDWELIQHVGLPFPTDRTPAYSNNQQGFVFAPTTPDVAAKQRLMIGQFLHNNPPDLSATIPAPDWRAPKTAPYLDDIINNSQGTLGLIQECLEKTDDTSWNPEERQPAYIAKRSISGIHQEGIAAGETATAKIPVVATSMVSIATDNYYSLGLGFGTYDFIEMTRRAAMSSSSPVLLGGYDYLVTADFILRPSVNLEFLEMFGSFDEKHTFAALSETLPIPIAVTALNATTSATNRPIVVDGIATEALRLSWDAPSFPQSYGMASLIQGATPNWLNDEIKFLAKTYRPYGTREPRNEIPDENTGRHFYIESESPLPLTGTSHDMHFVAGIDVMGRWSAFNKVNHDAVAIMPQKPALLSCRLAAVPLDPDDPEKPYPPLPANIPSTLEIEFAWEWTDRKLNKIEFSGTFYNPTTNPPPLHSTHFAVNATNSPVHAIITVSFTNTGKPSSDFGSVIELDATDATNPNLKKYKLILSGITSTMPSGAPHGVAYAVHARALEKVFVATNNFSEWVGPVKSRLDDPRKPEVVNLPATVQYTALPDATRKGRGRLSWSAVTGAIGYHAYEASEVAVREYLKPIAAAAHPPVALLPLTASLVERASQLRDLLLIPEYATAASRAFSKYNREILTSNTTEFELASGSEGLTIFRISSMNGSNIESDKSSPVFFAVPRIATPAPPILMVKSLDAGGIELKALNGAGSRPAGFRVYRVRKSIPSTDIGTKGLPVILDNNPAWEPTVYTNLQGGTLLGMRIVDTLSTRSWRPYYYQITAIGTKDDTNGILPGESTGSATQIAYFPPVSNPLMTLVSASVIAGKRTAKLISDIPFEGTDLGKATIEIYQMKDLDGKSSKVLITTYATADFPIAEAATITASDPIAGTTTFTLILPDDYIKGSIKVTDPLKKQTEIAIQF